MIQPVGFYANQDDAVIAAFQAQFVTLDNNCTLSELDRIALIAVLAQHRFGTAVDLEFNFWINAEHAIGDGVGTSMETEDPNAPLITALNLLQSIDPRDCQSLMRYLLQE